MAPGPYWLDGGRWAPAASPGVGTWWLLLPIGSLD